jgi:hypothetical protein
MDLSDSVVAEGSDGLPDGDGDRNATAELAERPSASNEEITQRIDDDSDRIVDLRDVDMDSNNADGADLELSEADDDDSSSISSISSSISSEGEEGGSQVIARRMHSDDDDNDEDVEEIPSFVVVADGKPNSKLVLRLIVGPKSCRQIFNLQHEDYAQFPRFRAYHRNEFLDGKVMQVNATHLTCFAVQAVFMVSAMMINL